MTKWYAVAGFIVALAIITPALIAVCWLLGLE